MALILVRPDDGAGKFIGAGGCIKMFRLLARLLAIGVLLLSAINAQPAAEPDDRSNGEVYCEGGRFTSSTECDASNCCQWDGACHSAVGAGACPSGGGSGVEAAGSPGGFITGLNYTVVDIAITGTAITTWQQGSDDGWFEIGLPFIFPWYGNAECAVHIGTNGYLTFGTAHFSGAHTEPFPGSPAGPVDGVIGVFWADINPGAGHAWIGNDCMYNNIQQYHVHKTGSHILFAADLIQDIADFRLDLA